MTNAEKLYMAAKLIREVADQISYSKSNEEAERRAYSAAIKVEALRGMLMRYRGLGRTRRAYTPEGGK